MLTNNFYSALAQNMVGTIKSNSIKNTSGSLTTLYNAAGGYLPFFISGQNNKVDLSRVREAYSGTYGGVVFGDGDTPATAEDYKLAGNIITGITANANLTRSINNGVAQIVAIYTITASSEVTIKEITAFTTSGGSDYYIVDRTVLDTPVTIPAGGVGQVVYTITFNYPTATA